jgi:ABC-type Fe3+ transport system permease subunit/DNA-binding beta-propeller fold protein YncE
MNWPLLQNSLLVAGTTTALAVSLGLIAALWLATLEARWRNVLLGAAVVALALPPFLVTNCWIRLLGETGAWRVWLPFKIYSLGGTIWILALLLWPIALFAVLAAWRRLEAAQFECEPAMTGFALLRWLLLPTARGELTLAAVLTFVLALNNFAVPAILQTRVLPDEVWVRFNTQFDALGALKLSVPLVIVPVLLLAWIARRGVSWPRMQGTVSARVFRRQLGLPWRCGCGGVTILVCALSVALPLAQIVMAKRTWAELPGALEASAGTIWNSLWFSAAAATVVMGLSILFYRRDSETQRAAASQRRLTSAATALAWLLFFVPGVLIGIALIKTFNRPVLVAFYQSAGICLLALVIRYLAVAWTAARHAMASVDSDLTDAGRLEGASHWQTLRFVIWPQVAPSLAAAWYVVYLLCLWDVESIVIVQPPGGETLALKIFNLLHYGHAAQVNALCLALLGLALAPLAAFAAFSRVRMLLRRRRAGSFLPQAAAVGLVALLTMFTGCEPTAGRNEASIESTFFVRAEVIGSRGVGLGEFNKPRSVTVDRQDHLYVVDMTGRVQKFSSAGSFLLSWQMPQTDLGKPKGMACDADGNIIVVEPHYSRVNHFTPQGELVAQWGERGTIAGKFGFPRAVAANSRGEIYVCEYAAMERVQSFAPLRRVATLNIQSSKPNIDGRPLTPAFSPSDGEWEKRAPRLVQVIGRAGTRPGEFNRPEGLAVDAQDRLYVADSCNHRIQVFSSDGRFLRAFGKAGSGLGELSYPYDVAVDARGNVFVCEFGNSRIQVFNPDGQAVEIIGGPGVEPGRFANPWSIALDSHENLYVADSQNHRVQKLIRQTGQVGRVRQRTEEKNGRRPAPTS